MAQIANYINSYSDNTAYSADSKDYPNVSYIQGTDEVKYSNPVVYATFNVSSSKVIVTYNPAAFAKIELNGQEIELVDTYKYDFGARGTYTLKYTLASETAIPDRTWGWCDELISMTDIPKTITSIGVSAFLGCIFNSFTIPSGVTGIGGTAFSSCPNLTSITIPNSVTSIGGDAFSSCSRLTSVIIESTTPPTIGSNTFAESYRQYPILYVPAESVNAYKAATGWSEYASRIQAIPTT